VLLEVVATARECGTFCSSMLALARNLDAGFPVAGMVFLTQQPILSAGHVCQLTSLEMCDFPDFCNVIVRTRNPEMDTGGKAWICKHFCVWI